MTFGCLRRIGTILGAGMLAACAPTIGVPNPELLATMTREGAFGREQTVRICGLLEAGIPERTARTLVENAWNEAEAGAFGLRMQLVSLKPWRSDARDTGAVFAEIQRIPLAPECDRLIVFLAHAEGRASRLAGAVSLYHAFVLASPESMRYSPMTPTEAVRHELYHLVGCGHADLMDACYRRIADAKSRRRGPDAFFPVYLYVLDEDIEKYCGENALIDDRAEANRIARLWVAQLERQAGGKAQPRRPCPSNERS